MKKVVEIKDQEFLQKLIRGGCTNLSEWIEKIAYEFCEEHVVEDRVSVESIDKRFYNDFTRYFIFSLSTMLFNFLINRGVGHIVEP